MTTTSLTPSTHTKATDQYRISEEARLNILAQSDSARLRAEIERKRLEFIQRYGNEFGVEDDAR